VGKSFVHVIQPSCTTGQAKNMLLGQYSASSSMTKCLPRTRFYATRRPGKFVLRLKLTRPLAKFLSTTQNHVAVNHDEALTLLRKAEALLPRVFPANTSSGVHRTTNTAEFWSGILSQAYDDLSAKTERPARVVGSHLYLASHKQAPDTYATLSVRFGRMG
jgi:hypothetical protein